MFLSIERLSEAEHQHEELFKALAAHDVQQAKQVMTHHISMGQQRMLKGIRTQVEERSRIKLWG